MRHRISRPAVALVVELAIAQGLPLAARAQDAHRERRAAVLASFQGGQITVGDLEDTLAIKPRAARELYATPEGRKRLLDELVRHDLLVLEATRRGYDHADAVTLAAKAQSGRILERQALMVDPAEISAADVARNFEARRQQYARPPRRLAHHIQVATLAEARALIVKLRKADGPRFAREAVKLSIDARTRAQGGALGYFDRGGKLEGDGPSPSVAPELAQAVFSLSHAGNILPDPVAHAGGYSVVMFDGETPGVVPQLAHYEAEIREALALERQRHALDALLANLRSEHPPEVHPELLPLIKLAPVAPLDMPQGFPAAPPDPRAPPIVVVDDGA